jgi:ankyrin repeat protein
MSDSKVLDAARRGDVESLRKVLNCHARVNARGSNRHTPLTLAARDGFTDCLFMLLDYGAHVNLATNSGDTALIWSVMHNHASCVGLLLDAKAKVDLPNLRGNTALHYATENGVPTLVHYLLHTGKADPNVQNNNGDTPLTIAAGKGYSDIVAILLTGTVTGVKSCYFTYLKFLKIRSLKIILKNYI